MEYVCHIQNVDLQCPLSERTLVARTDFRKFNEFSLDLFIKGLLNCKSLIVINRKMFQLVIDENRMVVTQTLTLIETFFVGALCKTFILKLHPLFIYICKTILFPVLQTM